MKKLLISIAISFSIFGLLFFFWIKNKNDQVNRETHIPYINTPEFPSGKVGELYNGELIGSLIGSKVKLNIIAQQIPEGLSLTDCKQEYNVSYLSKPNSLIICQLTGYPNESGSFDLSFEISAEKYNNSTTQKLYITINQ